MLLAGIQCLEFGFFWLCGFAFMASSFLLLAQKKPNQRKCAPGHKPSLLFMRACDLGRHFFAYFLVAVDKKVSRHTGEITKQKKQ